MPCHVSFKVTIPKNHWFAAEMLSGKYILVGCMVSPGFEFQDFELAKFTAMAKQYPNLTNLIKRFTPGEA